MKVLPLRKAEFFTIPVRAPVAVGRRFNAADV
jgi:hypothetical protein